MQNNTFIINKGSDLTFSGQFSTSSIDPETGETAEIPVDMSGSNIQVFDASTQILAFLNVVWADQNLGIFSGRMEWDDTIDISRQHTFRIQTVSENLIENQSTPVLTIKIQ